LINIAVAMRGLILPCLSSVLVRAWIFLDAPHLIREQSTVEKSRFHSLTGSRSVIADYSNAFQLSAAITRRCGHHGNLFM
jgi:hypothetical protein